MRLSLLCLTEVLDEGGMIICRVGDSRDFELCVRCCVPCQAIRV
jgi:hypothetical protein